MRRNTLTHQDLEISLVIRLLLRTPVMLSLKLGFLARNQAVFLRCDDRHDQHDLLLLFCACKVGRIVRNILYLFNGSDYPR
jgi:hypothetical protein